MSSAPRSRTRYYRPAPSTKRVLAPAARATLAALARVTPLSTLAVRARSTAITIENALAGVSLMPATCARLEAFAAKSGGAS